MNATECAGQERGKNYWQRIFLFIRQKDKDDEELVPRGEESEEGGCNHARKGEWQRYPK